MYYKFLERAQVLWPEKCVCPGTELTLLQSKNLACNIRHLAHGVSELWLAKSVVWTSSCSWNSSNYLYCGMWSSVTVRIVLGYPAHYLYQECYSVIYVPVLFMPNVSLFWINTEGALPLVSGSTELIARSTENSSRNLTWPLTEQPASTAWTTCLGSSLVPQSASNSLGDRAHSLIASSSFYLLS